MPGATDLSAEEAGLFAQHDRGGDATAVFILGAPRTGSTVLYQALAAAYALPYISNVANAETPRQPVVGILGSYGRREAGPFTSRFGKTDGPHAPSEGSAVMQYWCGGGHPSEIASSRVLPGRASHMVATVRTVASATGKPLLVKNAWNCFRLTSLAETLPRAAFIWIRRDVRAAARSDLAARYSVQGDPLAWNSATPRNVEVLRALPPAGQVLENQFEFARAIADASRALPPTRFTEVWYEDLRQDGNGALRRLSALAALAGLPFSPAPPDSFDQGDRTQLTAADEAALDVHLAADPARWRALRR